MYSVFRTGDVAVEAIQYNGTNPDEIIKFLGRSDEVDLSEYQETPIGMVIMREEGQINLLPGHYLIKDINNNFYGCEKELFSLVFYEVYSEIEEEG